MTLIVIIIFLALVFDFLNGKNDAANSIATVVATRVLSPKIAVLWAAFFNFYAAFAIGLSVATTIGKGIINPSAINSEIILAALLGAIIWTDLCTRLGLPISVSHSLIGGLIGATVVSKGTSVLILSGIIKIIIFIFLAPLIGLVLGSIIMVVVYWLFQYWSLQKVDSLFRKLQLASAAVYSISHGANDAQKTMGIIAVLLYSNGFLGNTFYIPIWVILACHAAIALGTITGGWKVVETMGMRLTKLQPVNGFCAETGGGITILAMSALGIPVSTTHTITGAIAGVGAVKRISAVKWDMAGKIVWAWILTIPASALMATLLYYLIITVKQFM